MNLRVHILLLSSCAALIGFGFAWQHTRYENLENPTDYLYSFPVGRIKEGLSTWVATRDRAGPLRGGFMRDGKLVFGSSSGYYTNRYWTGSRENNGMSGQPEEGWTGTIDASFDVILIPEGEKCRVKVVMHSFQQHVGHTHTIFPHFHKTGKYQEVKSDTYFEYLFLRKLGEIVGEKNMPPLKGSAEGDEWEGMEKPQTAR